MLVLKADPLSLSSVEHFWREDKFPLKVILANLIIQIANILIAYAMRSMPFYYIGIILHIIHNYKKQISCLHSSN